MKYHNTDKWYKIYPYTLGGMYTLVGNIPTGAKQVHINVTIDIS